MKLTGTRIYVPTPGALRQILAGSGIVGTVQPNGNVVIDYEGDKIMKQFGRETRSYNERLYQAWSRHTWGDRGYPTVARLWEIDPDELVHVGTYTVPSRNDFSEAKIVATALQRCWWDKPMIPAVREAVLRELCKPQIELHNKIAVNAWLAMETAVTS